MTKIKYTLILLILFGCETNKHQDVVTKNDTKVVLDSTPQNNKSINDSINVRISELTSLYKKLEIIDYDKIKINTNLTVVNKLDYVLKYLGKPDSITESGPQSISNWFGEIKTYHYYYKKSSFETDGKTAYLDRIYFKDGHFNVEFNDITFDDNTTIELFKERFPIAYKYSKIENLRNGPNEKFTIRILTKRTSDSAWLFEFENDKLDNVWIWNDNT